MPPLARRLRLALVPALLVLAGLGADDRAVDAAIRQLKAAVVPRAGATQLPLLASLRQLQDPSLRPYFFQLARHDDPLVRVHAILGLGEIDPARRIDPWQLRQLEVPEAQYAVLANALANELIDTDGIRALVAGDGLAPASRALLLAALAARGDPIDTQTARLLASDPDLITAGLAACLLAETGDAGALARHRERLSATEGLRRRRHLVELLAHVQQFLFRGATEFVAGVVQDPGSPLQLVQAGVRTMLALDPSRGASLWGQALGDDPAYGRCVRFALTLLAAAPPAPAETWDRLPQDDPLLARIAAAGRAIAGGPEAAGPLIALIDAGHPVAARLALEAAGALEQPQARRVYVHVIDVAAGDAEGREARLERAITATVGLFKIDPDALLGRLHGAEDDSAAQEAILLGLLETSSPQVGEAARGLKRLGFGRADSLSLILIAKHAPSLDPEELHRLGVVAGGGGRVSEVLQIQAAWLYLKHADRIEQALTASFVEAH